MLRRAKQDRGVPSAIGLAWPLVVVAAVWIYLGTSLVPTVMRANESDVLPYARQFVDSSWIPSDWYLNQDISYRYFFSVGAGELVQHVRFPLAAKVGRAVVTGLFATTAVVLASTFGVSAWLVLPWVALYYDDQSLVAGEWILHGFETKPFAYLCALLALAALHHRKYRWMLAASGLAVSFHVLVGAYSLFCIGVAILATQHRRAIGAMLRHLGWFVLTGGFGLYAIGSFLLSSDDLTPEQARRATSIYVEYRVPHHTLPSHWGEWEQWGAPLELWAALICLVLAWGWLRRDRACRLLGSYLAASAILFAIGLALYDAGLEKWMKFYWFRFPDTVIPLLGPFVLSMLVTQAANTPTGRPWLRRTPRLLLAAPALASAVLVLSAVEPGWLNGPPATFVKRLAPDKKSNPKAARRGRTAMRWIRKHTPRDARFIIDPTLEYFYIRAQRAAFVSWKHSPQSDRQFLEWFDRLRQVNNGREPSWRGYRMKAELRHRYPHLSPKRIRRIAERYNLGYVLFPTRAPLPFEKLYRNKWWTVYRLPKVSSGQATRAQDVPNAGAVAGRKAHLRRDPTESRRGKAGRTS